MIDYQANTLDERPDLQEIVEDLNDNSWPDFFENGDAYSWHKLWDELKNYQLVLTDQNDKLIAAGFTVPIIWNEGLDDLPESIEDILLNGLENKDGEINTLTAVAALVDKDFRQQNLSSVILKHMKTLAIREDLRNFILPVRPTWKSRYPLQSIESYANWCRQDGLLYDPWLRTHQRLKAKVIKCVESTLQVEGTIGEWEEWTNMIFPESGKYVVKDALQPVIIDVESDLGIYHDPNVWMQHPIP